MPPEGEEDEVSTETRAQPPLPELPLTHWEDTKNTLHLWAQIDGKMRMA